MQIYHRIPEEKQQEIIDVVDRVLANLIAPPRKCMVYLFDIYNDYIAPSYLPENINCGGCRVKVISQFKTITTQWKQQKAILEQ